MATSVQVSVLDPAIRKLGVPNPSTKQRRDALEGLNGLIGSWALDDFLIYSITRETFTLTINDAEYTIGASGDFNTVRPDQITDAFLRDSGTDHHLDIRHLNEYNRISEKTNNSRPDKLFYLPEHPLGKILFNFEPDKAYELHLNSLKALTEFAKISTTFSLPPGYKRMMIHNLAVDLSPEYDSELPASIFSIANTTLNDMMEFNSSVRGIDLVQADSALTWRLSK